MTRNDVVGTAYKPLISHVTVHISPLRPLRPLIGWQGLIKIKNDINQVVKARQNIAWQNTFLYLSFKRYRWYKKLLKYAIRKHAYNFRLTTGIICIEYNSRIVWYYNDHCHMFALSKLRKFYDFRLSWCIHAFFQVEIDLEYEIYLHVTPVIHIYGFPETA